MLGQRQFSSEHKNGLLERVKVQVIGLREVTFNGVLVVIFNTIQ